MEGLMGIAQVLWNEGSDFVRSLKGTTLQEIETHKDGPPVLVLRGYFGDVLPSESVYRGFVNALRGRGMNAHCPRLYTSWCDYEEGALLVGDALERLFPHHDRVTVVAHSYGGVLAALAKVEPDYAERIGQVFTIGTPFQGTPFAPLSWLVRKTTGASTELLDEYIKKFLPVSHDFTHVVSECDTISPIECGFVPHEVSRARLVNITETLPEVSVGHTGLVMNPIVQEFVAELVAEDVAAYAA